MSASDYLAAAALTASLFALWRQRRGRAPNVQVGASYRVRRPETSSDIRSTFLEIDVTITNRETVAIPLVLVEVRSKGWHAAPEHDPGDQLPALNLVSTVVRFRCPLPKSFRAHVVLGTGHTITSRRLRVDRTLVKQVNYVSDEEQAAQDRIRERLQTARERAHRRASEGPAER